MQATATMEGYIDERLCEELTLRLLNNNKAGESHAAKMRIVSNGVQPYIVQTGVDTDGETQEEVTTFRMKLEYDCGYKYLSCTGTEMLRIIKENLSRDK
ncbi:hypothetical protein DPX16_8231 [Anabarilius grahami]|uniref:Uncharacterized protein n=1 Tax=Anabarilius grahami TaxID=495550 RepID=A0A3N0Y804_ANAGA|nr:hypothetical protein DPX16_8231 [Anabarilius grahami]